MNKQFVWTVAAVLAGLVLWEIVGARVAAKLPA